MAKKGKLKTHIEYAAVRALVGGLGALPRAQAMALGRACGFAAYKVLGGLRRAGERNLEIAFPEMSADERRRILRASFDSLGRQLGAFSRLPHETPESLREIIEYDSEDVKLLDAAKAHGKGVIFLTGHIGAWELLSFAHAVFKEPLHFLVRPIDNPLIEDYVERIRTRFGNVPIDKKAAARRAIKILREGGALGILADLNSQEREGVFVPFLGRLACTTAGVAALALRTDASVIPVCAVWDESKNRYVMRGLPFVELERTGDEARDIVTNTANFTAALETLIRRYPEQWLWIHKRWKTRPPGEPDIYAKNAEIPANSAHFASHAAD